MKRSTKAALLSALIVPGAGHIFLKKHLYGILLMATSLAAVCYMLIKTTERAIAISEKILSSEIPPNLASILAVVSNQGAGADADLLNYAATVFIICWLIGIVDAYRLGEQAEAITPA